MTTFHTESELYSTTRAIKICKCRSISNLNFQLNSSQFSRLCSLEWNTKPFILNCYFIDDYNELYNGHLFDRYNIKMMKIIILTLTLSNDKWSIVFVIKSIRLILCIPLNKKMKTYFVNASSMPIAIEDTID